MKEFIVQVIEDIEFDPEGNVSLKSKIVGQIIRCKDCKYYGRADKRRFYRGMDCLNNHIDTIVPDKDFCSYAERRTE